MGVAQLNLRKGRMTTMKMMGSSRVRGVPVLVLIGFREYPSTRGRESEPYSQLETVRRSLPLPEKRLDGVRPQGTDHRPTVQPAASWQAVRGHRYRRLRGMIVGETAAKTTSIAPQGKQLATRSAGADEKLILAPQPSRSKNDGVHREDKRWSHAPAHPTGSCWPPPCGPSCAVSAKPRARLSRTGAPAPGVSLAGEPFGNRPRLSLASAGLIAGERR